MNKALLLSKRADGGCSVYCFQEVAVYWRAADRFDSLKLTRTGYIQSLSKKERSLKNQIKTDSVQSSSNTSKNYLLKIYSQHGNFLNAI